MKKTNGVITLESGESVKDFLPAGAPVPEFEYLYAPFGVKLRSFGSAYVWEVATEDDFRNSESVRLGVAPELVPLDPSCSGVPPCPQSTCGGFSVCCSHLQNDGATTHFYCGCGVY
jgi:hypothetical protein